MTKKAKWTSHLAEWRAYRGLTLQQVADKIGTDHTVVQRWQAGSRQPNAGNMRALAEALGITIGQLIEERPPLEGKGQDIEVHTKDVGLSQLKFNPLELLSSVGNNPPMDLGGDPVKNGQLILRAVQKLRAELSKFSESMNEGIGELAQAVEQAEQIERELEKQQPPKGRRRSTK